MQRKLYELKENPLSIAIYGENEDVADLVESIKKDGILTPLIVKPDGTIISGHRRYRAARKAGLITVPVEEKTPKDKLEEERWIISANKQREKTPEQEGNEIKRLKEIYAAEGRERILAVGARNNAERAERAAFSETKKAAIGTKAPFSVTEVTEKVTEKVTEPEPTAVPDIEAVYTEAVERMEKKEEPKAEPINMNKRIAKELGISTGRIHQIETVCDAAKAGVPEAKEALERANKGEITINRAYEITKKATTPEKPLEIPFVGGKIEPGKAQDCMSAALKVNPWVLSIERDLRQPEPSISLGEVMQLAAFLGTHIDLLSGFREILLDYINEQRRQRGDDTEEYY